MQKCDLLIAKDILQHWPIDEIQYFIKKILPNFKYAIITHDFDNNPNKDISLGNTTTIDLQAPHFNMTKNIKVLIIMLME